MAIVEGSLQIIGFTIVKYFIYANIKYVLGTILVRLAAHYQCTYERRVNKQSDFVNCCGPLINCFIKFS